MELLTVSEAARRLKVSESFLNKLRGSGGGPIFCRAGRAVRYRPEDLDAWISACMANSTSEYDAKGAR